MALLQGVMLLGLWWLQHSPADLPEQLSCRVSKGRTTDPLFHILSPSIHLQQRGWWELCAAPSWHLMLCVASSPPCTLVSLFAGPQCLFLNYCIWNHLPNCAAKNTPNNQVIMMWVDELFLYTVLIATKSLNPFRRLEKVKQEYYQQCLVLC